MEGKRQHRRSPPSPAATRTVLEDGDLLREILLRLAFPTCLVRAALVCKRWLRHASDPAFLRRFRDLHPPRLLGFYVDSASHALPRFVPLPLPPPLAAAVRRARFDLDTDDFYLGMAVYYCRNGRLLACYTTGGKSTFRLRTPLHPATDGAVISTRRSPPLHDWKSWYTLLPEDGSDGGLSWKVVTVVSSEREAFAKVEVILETGVWDDARTSASIVLPVHWKRSMHRGLLHNGKLYMLGTTGYILGLKLASTSLFFIELPDAVRNDRMQSFQLSRKVSQTGNSGLYLIHVKGLKINVWLHGTDGDRTGQWVLVDTLCLRQVFGHLVKPSWESGHSCISLAGSGDNAEFVFLEVDGEIFCMHIISRTVEKVYELTVKGDFLFEIYPFMMVWPPVFPALIGRHDQE